MQNQFKFFERFWKTIGTMGIAISLGTTILYSAELKQYKAKQPLIEQGKQIFPENCIPCHGEKGKGDGPAAHNLPSKPRDLTNPPEYKYGESLEIVLQTISNGIPDTPMAPWGIKLSPDQIRAAATYIVDGLQEKK